MIESISGFLNTALVVALGVIGWIIKRVIERLDLGEKSKKGGLTAKGRAKYNRATGSNLKAPQPGGGPRKRSFCARMSGVKGPMKKPNGKPTRKALALRRWKC